MVTGKERVVVLLFYLEWHFSRSLKNMKCCGDLWVVSQTQHLASNVDCNNHIPYLNKWHNHPSMTQPSYKHISFPFSQLLCPVIDIISFESTFPSLSTCYLQVEPHEMAIHQIKKSWILACAHQTHFVFLQGMQKDYFPDSLVPWLSSGQNCCMTLPGLHPKISSQYQYLL